MIQIKILLACIVCRLVKLAARIMKRGGTAMPGKFALKVFPGVLTYLARGVDVIMVTGTNGKTTSAGMLRHILDEAGTDYLSNRSGANLMSGVTAEFILNANLFGKPKKHLAVIECDEGAFPSVAAALQPRLVLATNLFRDQLDRYGEITHTRSSLISGLKKAPKAIACLNADCSLTATMGEELENPCFYYGVNAEVAARESNVSDAAYCLHCGTRYQYRRHTFAHLGDWYCPNCGLSRPEPQYAAEEVIPGPDGSSVKLKAPGGTYDVEVALPALYNVYNAVGVLAAAELMGWSLKDAAASLQKFGAVFGRMESLTVGGTPARIVLVKNPAGCDRALEYLASVPGEYFPVFCLNDNLPDGTDVSWIWDADYEALLGKRSYDKIGVYGTRAGDMRLRLKYAGADDSRIVTFATADELGEAVMQSDKPVYVLPNYTSMLTVRDKLASLAGVGKFWEG